MSNPIVTSSTPHATISNRAVPGSGALTHPELSPRTVVADVTIRATAEATAHKGDLGDD
jgi:hypothetical protein